MEEYKDEIARWAESLTPDGSPGTLQQTLRAVYGDKRYETEMARQDRLATMYLRRVDTINRLYRIGVVYAHLFGIMLLALMAAGVVKITLG